MIILGIDPGTAALGYGIVERIGSRLRAVDHGCFVTSADTSLPELRSWLGGVGAPIAPTHERLRTRAWRLNRRMRALATGRPTSDIR